MEADKNGCVVEDGTLISYRGDRRDLIISEGIKVIPESVIVSHYLTPIRSIHLPESLKSFGISKRIIREEGNRIEVNLPEGYLKTQERLPSNTLLLLQTCWVEEATLKDYAAICLFQSNASLVEYCKEQLEPAEEVISCFTELLEADVKKNCMVKAAEYALENCEDISIQAASKLLELCVQKKAKKAAALMEVVIRQKQEEQAEKNAPAAVVYTEENVSLLDEAVKRNHGVPELFSKVKDKNGNPASELLVKRAVVPYLMQYTGMPKFTAAYKTDSLFVRLDEEADKAAAFLDMESLQAILPEMLSWGQGWTLPYLRYASPEQIKEMIRKMEAWEDWKQYKNEGRKNIILARTGLLLNDTVEVISKIAQDKNLGKYARMRGIDEMAVIDTMFYVGPSKGQFLESDGTKSYCFPNETYRAVFEEDLKLALYDVQTGEKNPGFWPKYEESNADGNGFGARVSYGMLKEHMEKIASDRILLLKDAFLLRKTREAKGWLLSYTQNPVLRTIAGQIVWNQGKDTFLLTREGFCDCNGKEYTMNPDIPVGVASPDEMKWEDVKAWKKLLQEKKISQPFHQI